MKLNFNYIPKIVNHPMCLDFLNTLYSWRATMLKMQSRTIWKLMEAMCFSSKKYRKLINGFDNFVSDKFF